MMPNDATHGFGEGRRAAINAIHVRLRGGRWRCSGFAKISLNRAPFLSESSCWRALGVRG
jgi:hypothetical protein